MLAPWTGLTWERSSVENVTYRYLTFRRLPPRSAFALLNSWHSPSFSADQRVAEGRYISSIAPCGKLNIPEGRFRGIRF